MAKSSFFISDNSDIENRKFEAARGLYQSGNYQAALKLYLDMINMSVSYKLYYEVGRCYYKLDDLVNAEIYFTRSVELDFYKNPSYVFLGNICFKQQNIQKAIEYWITSFSYKPDDESVCLNLATSYFSNGMKFQSLIFYEKYLKYAKDKHNSHYLDIKKNIESFAQLGKDFYYKALKSISMQDNSTAKKALDYAVKNYPISFDTNYLLGKIYFNENKYLEALAYFKQAYCIDSKSLDLLEYLSTTCAKLGDFTSSYCCMKRMLPLVINNQKEYYEIIKTTKEMEASFDNYSYQAHKDWGDKYYEENNYYFALFEYENCLILDTRLSDVLDSKVQNLRRFLNPEERIIKSCFEKGGVFYTDKNYKESNKYFTKIMTLAKEDSSEYKFAKSRIVNV